MKLTFEENFLLGSTIKLIISTKMFVSFVQLYFEYYLQLFYPQFIITFNLNSYANSFALVKTKKQKFPYKKTIINVIRFV